MAPRKLGVSRAAALLVAGAIAAQPTPAAADAGDCIEIHEQALALKKRGKLTQAHARFARCTEPRCPGPVREECTAQARRLASIIPSVIPRARTRAGAELADVRVRVDDRLLTERLDGRAHRLDPGPHTFRFETAGAPPVELSVVLAEGERLRRVEAIFTPAEPDGQPAPIPTAVYVLGGVGLAGLVGFTVFGLSGLSEESDLETCEPGCPTERTDDLKRTYLIADISLAIGVVALGGATYLYLGSRGGSPQAPAHGGASLGIGGVF